MLLVILENLEFVLYYLCIDCKCIILSSSTNNVNGLHTKAASGLDIFMTKKQQNQTYNKA